MFSGKRVLVTGATGLIGSHLVQALLQNGAKVWAVGRNEKKLCACFEEQLSSGNLFCVAADVSKGLPEIEEHVDYLFHAASPMEPSVIEERPVDVIVPNLQGTINCLEFLRKQKCHSVSSGRMIVFSSVTVYGRTSDIDRRVSELDTTITDGLHVQSAPYSQSKRMSEVIARAYQKQYGIDMVIVRFSTVYGNTKYRPNTAFFEFLEKAVQGEDIWVNSNAAPRRDNIYIDDAIAGLLVAAQSGATGEAYNISSNAELGNFAAVDEIAQIIAKVQNELTGNEKNLVSVHYRTEESKLRTGGVILDNTKLKELGWKVQINIEDGIRKTLLSY